MKGLPSYFRHIQKILLRKGCNPADTEDLIQDAFIKMHEYCHKGGEVRQPEGFLVRTALRLAINARRDAHPELYVDQKIEDLAFLADTNPMPDEVLAGDQCLKRMRSSLDAVSPRTREVFFMNRLDGLSYQQIAHQLGVSVSAVEKHIATAIATLTHQNFNT